MKKYFILIMCLFFSSLSVAEEINVILEKAPIDIHNKGSIEKGAKYFATVCMACHTLEYMRYNKIAEAAGITYDRMPFKLSASVYGVKPPDLSLETSVRGADWVYTYLHSFYDDPTRPTHINNLLLPNTAMPGILAVFQGQQTLVVDLKKSNANDLHWYDVLELQKQGTLSPDDYDAMIKDITNFLVYSAEPFTVHQQAIGRWVLGYLILLFFLVYFLKRRIWRNIKK